MGEGSSALVFVFFFVLCFFSEVNFTWLTQVHFCVDQLLNAVVYLHNLEPLMLPAVPPMQTCYKCETNLGNSYLIARQLLSQGKQAHISSGQGKCKWVLRDSTTRSIQSLRLFTNNDKTSYFLGYRKATLRQSCSAVYWSVQEIGFQGNQKIWPHWPLLPLPLSTAQRVTSLWGSTTQLHYLTFHRNLSATAKVFVIV